MNRNECAVPLFRLNEMKHCLRNGNAKAVIALNRTFFESRGRAELRRPESARLVKSLGLGAEATNGFLTRVATLQAYLRHDFRREYERRIRAAAAAGRER
jgi:hypothetical protein